MGEVNSTEIELGEKPEVVLAGETQVSQRVCCWA